MSSSLAIQKSAFNKHGVLTYNPFFFSTSLLQTMNRMILNSHFYIINKDNVASLADWPPSLATSSSLTNWPRVGYRNLFTVTTVYCYDYGQVRALHAYCACKG